MPVRAMLDHDQSCTGRIWELNFKHRWGWIRGDDKSVVIFYDSGVLGDGFDRLKVGHKVSFELLNDSNTVAVNIERVWKSKMSSHAEVLKPVWLINDPTPPTHGSIHVALSTKATPLT